MRGLRSRLAWRYAAAAFALLAVGGCGTREEAEPEPPRTEPIVESGEAVELAPGQGFRFTAHYHGGNGPPGLALGADGVRRLELLDARHPVLCVPAPYVIRQPVTASSPLTLRTAYGLARESWDKLGGGVRFSVRVRREDEVLELLSAEVKRWRGEEEDHWSPVSLDIPADPGETVEIELAAEIVGTPRPGPEEDYTGAYALWMNPTLFAASAEPRPNIVFVYIDALRPDHLGCYGYERETSPCLDRVAEEGVLFEDANSQATWTMPSTHSLLTSSYRFVRGFRHNSSESAFGDGGDTESWSRPVAMPVSLQGELGTAGYTTLACVGGGFLTPALGFDAGFDWYWSPQHVPMLVDQLGVITRKLSEDPAQPFFLFLHTYEVHNYFQGWAHAIDHFDRGYLGPLTDPRQLMPAVLEGDPEELTPSDLQYIQDLYDGEIRHTDRYLSFFLDWLRSQPWDEGTIIVVTADHGEALGQHGVMSHGGIPYREVMHVPLLIRLPDGRWRGRRVCEPVALADLMPTLLQLAGASPPAGIVGSSLVSLLERGAWDADRPLLCESRGSALTVRTGDWVYVASRGELEEELYDLATDPGETINLVEAETDQLDEMRRVLAALAMKAALGYRLVAAGERPGSLTVELAVEGRLGYVDVPTVRESDALQIAGGEEGQKARVTLEAGGAPHVVLFDPEDLAATVHVSAWLDGEAVETARFHLGAKAVQPEEVPVAVGPDFRSVLLADEPPVPEHPDTWGLWLWVPPHADHIGAVEGLTVDQIPEGVLEQLRSLGYLR